MARHSSQSKEPASSWQRLRASVHRRDVWIAVIFLVIGLGFNYLLFPHDYGLLGYENSVIKVFDATSLSQGLKLLDAENQPIRGDVYAIETKLANLGTIPFDTVRRAVEISFGPSEKAHVIDSRVSDAAGDDVSHFKAVLEGNSVVRVTWDAFDPGQYVKITSLVSAASPVEPKVGGTILGVSISEGRKSPSWYDNFVLFILMPIVAVGAGLMAVICTWGGVEAVGSRKYTEAAFTTVMALLAWSMMLLFLFVEYLVWSRPIMPS